MARLSLGDRSSTFEARKDVPFTHQQTYISLTRQLTRYSHIILLDPSIDELSPYQMQIQRDLSSPLPYHRQKWLHNIEHSRTLLLQLERSAQQIRVQRSKADVLRDLVEKRKIIKRLKDRIEEFGGDAEARGFDWDHLEGGETLEEILGRPPEQEAKPERGRQDNVIEGKPSSVEEEEGSSEAKKNQNATEQREVLFGPHQRRGHRGTTTNDAATTSGFSNLHTTEKKLQQTSALNETLTASLLNGAILMKQQVQRMHATLELDKGITGKAADGLESSVSAMDRASRNMGVLRRMSEGQGWWGRMMLYAWILGMWVACILLVFVGPKLRF